MDLWEKISLFEDDTSIPRFINLKSLDHLANMHWASEGDNDWTGSKIHSFSYRGGSSISKEESTMIHGFICSIVDVQQCKKNNVKLYEDIFEKPYLQATGMFYRYQVLPKC